MILSIPHTGLSVHLAGILVPLAVYFFVLGMLNTRRHPQMLTARQDLALLVLALSPLALLPMVNAWGLAAALAVAGVGALLALTLHRLIPPRGDWVIYNITPGQARRAVRRGLQQCGLEAEPCREGYQLSENRGLLRVGGFPLLHNVSLRLENALADLARTLPGHLHGQLVQMEAEQRPTGLAMLLVSTAMIVVPLTLAAPRAGEIVRLLGDLLK